jgi:large subunit ribosomal protein L19
MSQQLLREIEQSYLKTDLPDLQPGDTVKVMVRIKEGAKERLQGFEGVVIKLQGSGTNRSVTVRRVFQDVGVERSFLIHAPKIESIKVLRRGIVRRARLYYLRNLRGKSARIKERLVVKSAEAKQKVPATV